VDNFTRPSDFWKELLPVPVKLVLEVFQENAKKHKDHGLCDEGGLMAFLCCLYGGCQFKPGAGVRATEKQGMMPVPTFGGFMSHGKFNRWLRYLAEGPKGATDRGPWGEIRWLVHGYNLNRKKTVEPSWLVVVDETMWAWAGQQGMPHLSFVRRKPEPLGAEVKNLCCGESGVMLNLELQEGKVKMARGKFCAEHKATTACTLRLAYKGGLDETGMREDGKVKRVLVGDSWFASEETAKALKGNWGLIYSPL
jgi:hypothetical protein